MACEGFDPFQKCRLHELGERGCHERSGGRYERRRIEVAVWTFIMSKHVGPTATDSDLNSLDGIKNRSEEHTSELQSLMRISYAVFCLKKKNTTTNMTKSEI